MVSTGLQFSLDPTVIDFHSESMATVGIIHCVDSIGRIRTEVLEANGERPVTEVLRSVYGPTITIDDLLCGNSLPGDSPTDISVPGDSAQAAISWDRWQAYNPITILGARNVHPGSGSTEVSVLAGPDSGFTIGINSRSPSVSRLADHGGVVVHDPCLSREPVLLELAPERQHPFTTCGATIFAPLTALDAQSPPVAPATVSPDRVDEPRASKPPQWWVYVIPIVIGVVLALATGMWWFLLFSASAPISGIVAHAMDKRRLKREWEAHGADCAAACERALTRTEQLVADHRAHLNGASGLVLGFGQVLSPISADEALHSRVDHLGGRIIIPEVPIRVDPLTTRVEVTGKLECLLGVAYAWLSDSEWSWRLSEGLRGRPEFLGTQWARGDSAGCLGLELSIIGSGAGAATEKSTGSGVDARLTLVPPTAKSLVSISLGQLAQARTLSSTALDGPVPGRTFTATMMAAGRFLLSGRDTSNPGGGEIFPRQGLGDHCDDAVDVIRRRWEERRFRSVPVGSNEHGPVRLDLFADGPHALVAGTTGSGKSIFLQTWLLSMTLHHSPRQLILVLIDFKGGSAFAPLERLPHTDCVLDDFDSAAAYRALVSVRAEITRRERLVADHGCADVFELDDPPPRLVVVIDEFHALMSTHPKAAELIEHLTALGRSLGVHLILATQRPLGVVTARMKANINIRVCLRVRDEADSLDVLSVPDAAHLPVTSPGAAHLDTGHALTSVQVATPIIPSSSTSTMAPSRPRLRPWDPDRPVFPERPLRGIDVDAIIVAAAGGEDFSSPIVLPPLSSSDDAEIEESETGAEAVAMPCGLVDFPASQRQDRWFYQPESDGSLVVIGPSTSVRHSTLARLAVTASTTWRLVALGQMAQILEWAAITCSLNEDWKFRSILTHLRQPGPPTLVVCDNWSELIDGLDHRMASEAELLLKHGESHNLRFLIGSERSNSSTIRGFGTQLIYPPNSANDGLSVGLSRQRFLGTWPDFRAVLTGPSARDAGSDGADVQIRPYLGGPQVLQSIGPHWHGLGAETSLHGPGTSRGPSDFHDPAISHKSSASHGSGIPLGIDPFGTTVEWNPLVHGPVLTVRGSPRSGKSACGAWINANAEVLVHDDVHLDTNSATVDLIDSHRHVVIMPTRFAPGYGSPMAKAQSLGPLLILGSHSRSDLAGLGLSHLPPLDGENGTGWFVTDSATTAITVFRLPEDDRTIDRSEPSQKSAGGPVRVS